MVSPVSSDPDLTRGRVPSAFARVYPTDDLQSAGLALLAAQLDAKRVFVLDDGGPFGTLLADAFVRAAARVHVRIVGSDSWNPAAPTRTGPLSAVAAAHPDTVVLSGTLDDGGIAVLRALRRRIGPSVKLLLTDGFTPTETLAQRAGRLADGAYISITGATLDALTTPGRTFGRELAAVAPGAETDPASYYAAQAAGVLLDAIAGSNGTRRSVVRGMRGTRLRDGLFGPVAFDRHGDIREPAISILRVRVGDHSRSDFPDARVAQVIRPSRALVGP
jgi:branched-chain amino acid transport system substrate-binding protein